MRAEDAELLVHVGPDAPMGQLMRHYWFPAAKSSELEAGGSPVRLRLLGENLIGFRSPDGEVGLTEHACAHRRASLFFGRNEPGGIRCVYHGWKFDKTGQCTETPSEAPDAEFTANIGIKAYPTKEMYGIVWAYMGPASPPPPFPRFDIEEIPGERLMITFMLRECNWLQALEGDIDTAHFPFLHTGGAKPDDFEPGSPEYYLQLTKHPKFDCLETAFGTMCSGSRPAGDGGLYHRIGEFLMPFYTMVPADPIGHNRLRAWVPVDDHHTMLVVISEPRPRPADKDKDGKPFAGITRDYEYLANTSDWYGRWRVEQNAANDYQISREMQNQGSFTGIKGVTIQDQAITESMGPIVDRTLERLGRSDQMIMLTRRHLLQAVRALRDEAKLPASVGDVGIFQHLRAGYFTIPKDVDWLDEFNRYRLSWSGGSASPIPRGKAAPS